MAKKKYKIAQLGAFTDPQSQYNWQSFGDPNTPQVPVSDPLAHMQIDPSQQVQHPELQLQYEHRKAPYSGTYDLNPYVKLFNMAARLTTGVANKVTDAKNTRYETQQQVEAMQPANWESTVENGLSDKPAYFKTGGVTKAEAYAILKQGEVKGHKLSRQQKILFRKIAKTGKMPPPNSINQTGGQPANVVEAEKGEVFQTTDGDLQKVPESAPTHEGGGYMLDNAARILEDTSDKRSDKDSKALRVSPALASLLTGYDPKGGDMTHSKTMEFAKKKIKQDVDKYQSKIKQNVETLNNNNEDRYANASLKLNMMQMQNIPTEGQVFDTIFQHQEMLKDAAGIQNPQAKCGGRYKAQWGMSNRGSMAAADVADGDPTGEWGKRWRKAASALPPALPVVIDPTTGLPVYPGGKTTIGATTPKGQNNGFGFQGGLDAYKSAWKDVMDLGKYTNAKDAQGATYDYLAENAPDVLKNMWSQYGLTELGRTNASALQSAGIQLQKDPNDKYGRLNFKDVSSLTPEQLKALNKLAYADDMLGIRTLTPKSLPDDPAAPQAPAAPDAPAAPQGRPPLNLQNNPKSPFFEPLHWFDVAGPLNQLTEGRIPVRHNPAQLEQIRLRMQNPLPTLQSGERDYNAALQGLPQNSQGYANQANLFSKKYSFDNQVLGQYENANNQTKNQEVIANADTRGKQSMLDQSARENTERKYLGSKEAERQQKAQALDELYTRLAQNRKLNREGNLLMQMFPAFDQNAQYNGYRVPLRMPLNTPNTPLNVPIPTPVQAKPSRERNILISPITGKKFTF